MKPGKLVAIAVDVYGYSDANDAYHQRPFRVLLHHTLANWSVSEVFDYFTYFQLQHVSARMIPLTHPELATIACMEKSIERRCTYETR